MSFVQRFQTFGESFKVVVCLMCLSASLMMLFAQPASANQLGVMVSHEDTTCEDNNGDGDCDPPSMIKPHSERV